MSKKKKDGVLRLLQDFVTDSYLMKMKNENNHKTSTELKKKEQDPFCFVLKEFVSNMFYRIWLVSKMFDV